MNYLLLLISLLLLDHVDEHTSIPSSGTPDLILIWFCKVLFQYDRKRFHIDTLSTPTKSNTFLWNVFHVLLKLKLYGLVQVFNVSIYCFVISTNVTCICSFISISFLNCMTKCHIFYMRIYLMLKLKHLPLQIYLLPFLLSLILYEESKYDRISLVPIIR